MKSKNREGWILIRDIALAALATGIISGLGSVLTSRYLNGSENVWWRYLLLVCTLAIIWFFVWRPLSRREKARQEREKLENRADTSGNRSEPTERE